MSHSAQLVFFRFVAAPGRDLRQLEPSVVSDEECQEFLRDWVVLPTSALDGSHLDVKLYWEFRSQRPLLRAENLYFYESDWLTAIHCRAHSGFFEEDLDVDGISQISPDFDRFDPSAWRPCRYGFDRIEARFHEPQALEAPWEQHQDRWILRGAGSYFSHNTAPYYWEPALSPHRDASGYTTIERSEPWDAVAMLAERPVQQLEWLWHGRVVHRAFSQSGTFLEPPRDGLWHTCLDGWDNCIDERFLQETKPAAP